MIVRLNYLKKHFASLKNYICQVAGVGTGGTITGIGQKMKELCPNCVIVATDPEQSPPTEANNLEEEESYHVEGIGYFPVSTVLDRNFIDKWYKINHMESLLLARRLIKEEGLLCGKYLAKL